MVDINGKIFLFVIQKDHSSGFIEFKVEAWPTMNFKGWKHNLACGLYISDIIGLDFTLWFSFVFLLPIDLL